METQITIVDPKEFGLEHLKQLGEKILELSRKCDDELFKKNEIKESKEYLDLIEQAKQIILKQEELLKDVGDSTQQLEEAKQEAARVMEHERLDECGMLRAKYSESKKVDTEKTYEVLGKVNFLQLATITQKALNEFAKNNKKEYDKDTIDTLIITKKGEIKTVELI